MWPNLTVLFARAVDTAWRSLDWYCSHKTSIWQVPCLTLTHVISLTYSLHFIIFESFLIKAKGEASGSFLTKHVCPSCDTGVSSFKSKAQVQTNKQTHSKTFLQGKSPTQLRTPAMACHVVAFSAPPPPSSIIQKPHVYDHHKECNVVFFISAWWTFYYWLSISSTNKCTFLFLFNLPYICFGHHHGTLISSLHCSLPHLVLSQPLHCLRLLFTLAITSIHSFFK
jgi:hypothetical protein